MDHLHERGHSETMVFAWGGLDRAEDLRRHPDRLAAMPARTLPLWSGKPLMTEALDALVTLEGAGPEDHGDPVLIGRMGAEVLLARDVSDMAAEGGDQDVGAFLDPSVQRVAGMPGIFAELRGAMALLSPPDAEIAATAKGVIEWHRTHGFCASCGAPTRPGKAGWMRACTGCGRAHFPRTDPVVIMLVTRGNECLLGRSPAWPDRFYSCLAGFMEPGETMEGAVRRETWEETGIRVGRVDYVASQPWAFPHSLMLGAHGHALPGEIEIDPEEIADAAWVSRERLVDVFDGRDAAMTPAREGSIARFLLQSWLAGLV